MPPHPAIATTAEIVAEIKAGRMVILVDEEDRENEGDLVMAAEHVTAEAINFMAKFGRGLVCLTLTEDRCKKLGLVQMARNNKAQYGTAFTVSIEAAEGVTTGISAGDRARTIQVAVAKASTADDIVQPGHIFPITAREGGVLVRAGHTEAGCDLSSLAGLEPAAAICEIMNDDGTMARLPELIAFAQLHNLKIGTIADLIAWRRQNDRFLERRIEAPLESDYGSGFRTVCFRNTMDNSEHIAIVHGDIKPDSTTLVRVHRTDILADILGEKGPRSGLVSRAMRLIAGDPNPGVVVFVNTMQPGSLAERLGLKSAAPRDPSAPLREYGIGAQILRELGVRRMVYLSDTQPTRLAGLDGYGLTIEGWRRLNEETT